MSNLISSISGLLSPNIVGKLASVIGSNGAATSTALSSMLPSIMGGLAKKGATLEGASSMLNLIKNNDLGAGTLNNLTSSLSGGGATDALLAKGGKLTEALFGNDAESMMGKSGMDSGSTSKLMNLLTPIAMGAIGKKVNADNLDAAGLQSLLKSQTMTVVKDDVKAATSGHVTQSQNRAVAREKSGGSMMRWLIPLFFLLAAAWFFTQHLGDKAAAESTPAPAKTTAAAPAKTKAATHKHTHTHADGTVHEGASHGSEHTHTHADGTVHHGASHGSETSETRSASQAGSGDVLKKTMMSLGLSMDPAGNLVKNNQILLKAGEFTAKAGGLFGTDGQKIDLMKIANEAGKAAEGAVKAAGDKIMKK